MRIVKFTLLAVILIYVLPAALATLLWWIGDHPGTWRDADWTSAAVLPHADADGSAALYVLSARTGGMKGAVSEHSWIVVKDKGSHVFERWDKVGWGLPIRHNAYPADGRWYSNAPRVVVARTGAAAEALIPQVRQAIDTYPFAMRGGYTIFPGPNSNSFVAHVLRHVPALGAILPPVGIGRDYPVDGRMAAFDAGLGDVRLSLAGYAGVTAGLTSGFEINLLGLVAGIDPRHLAVKIPAFGTFALLRDRGGEF